MDKRRAGITAVLLVLGVMICISVSLYTGKRTIAIETSANVTSKISEESETGSTESESETEENGSFPVYICGEVVFPGVYEMDAPFFLYELIEKAGGLTDHADVEHIDMVYYLETSQSIYIPPVSDLDNTEVTGEQDQDNRWIPQQDKGTSSTRRVNINTADEDTLSTLSGIGEKTAQKIIAYREENGLFAEKEDIKNVPGIGDSKYEAIKDEICVS